MRRPDRSRRRERSVDHAERSVDHAERSAAFLRGLTVGALVGAAIAGSAIWRRIFTSRPGDHEPPARPRD